MEAINNRQYMQSFGNTSNSSYQSLISDNEVYVRIDSINTGSFQVKNDTKLIACVGSRHSFLPYAHEFRAGSKVNHVWNFTYKNQDRSSFVLVLFKRQLFGGDKEIGEIELKLNAFQPNAVTQHTFVLHSPQKNSIPAKVTLSVHICEDGNEKFNAPEAATMHSQYESLHKTTYYN